MRLLVVITLLFTSACTIGLSASRTLGLSYPDLDAYCEPVHEDLLFCRDDGERTWRCVANEYGWKCERMS